MHCNRWGMKVHLKSVYVWYIFPAIFGPFQWPPQDQMSFKSVFSRQNTIIEVKLNICIWSEFVLEMCLLEALNFFQIITSVLICFPNKNEEKIQELCSSLFLFGLLFKPTSKTLSVLKIILSIRLTFTEIPPPF